MSIHFIRRIKLLPWVTLNLGKRGVSFSFGPRGAKFTVGQSGMSGSVGATGSGLSYRKQKSTNSAHKFQYPWVKEKEGDKSNVKK